MEIIKAINPVDYGSDTTKVFLAGTIDNGNSDDWQKTVAEFFEHTEGLTLINPRRDDWDSSWKAEASNPVFREQVEWELRNLYTCDIILIYFAPGSSSPISLLELGLFLDKEIIIVVPDGYYRKGNIEVAADFLLGKKVHNYLLDGLLELKEKLNEN